MPKQKYIGWVNYWCPEVKGEDVCITFYADNPSPGIINSAEPLPLRECGRDIYSLECENEPNCGAQILTRVLKSTPKLEKLYEPTQTSLEILTKKETNRSLIANSK